VNPSEILIPLRLETTELCWVAAMHAIRAAQRLREAKESLRFATRERPEGAWATITIDLARP
jgi:hypothetical protein